MKDIKHIRWDFHSVAWVMPQGLDLGVQGGKGSKKFFSEIQPNLVCVTRMANATAQFFWSPSPWGGAKYHLLSTTKSISNIF